jgi:hypothetical protein
MPSVSNGKLRIQREALEVFATPIWVGAGTAGSSATGLWRIRNKWRTQTLRIGDVREDFVRRDLRQRIDTATQDFVRRDLRQRIDTATRTRLDFVDVLIEVIHVAAASCEAKRCQDQDQAIFHDLFDWGSVHDHCASSSR